MFKYSVYLVMLYLLILFLKDDILKTPPMREEKDPQCRRIPNTLMKILCFQRGGV